VVNKRLFFTNTIHAMMFSR